MSQPTPGQIASDAIGLFLEYRDKHGCSELNARVQAVMDIIEGAANEAVAQLEREQAARRPFAYPDEDPRTTELRRQQ